MTAPTSARTTSAVGAGAERYLAFGLGGESYALPIRDVTEILEVRPQTAVPMAPAHVRGVINLRGRAVPVIDLSARFGGPETQVARRTAIVIVAPAGTARQVGILVDAVNSVVHLDASDVEPAPSFGAAAEAGVVAGMARHGDGFVVVLDLRALLGEIEDAQA